MILKKKKLKYEFVITGLNIEGDESSVYTILINDKYFYIGFSTQILARLKTHISFLNSGTFKGDRFLKKGEKVNKVVVEILFRGDKDEARSKEYNLIKKYNASFVFLNNLNKKLERKRKRENDRAVNFSISLHRELYEKLIRMCEESESNISYGISRLIKNANKIQR